MLVNVIRPVPPQAVDFVAEHEAPGGVPVLEAYPDPATHGAPWTIGFGSTAGVTRGMKITPEEARARLLAGLEGAAERLEGLVGEACVTELTSNQYSALISFVYNTKVVPTDRIWAALRAQKFDLIPGLLMLYVNAAGKKMDGLVRRRADEVKLWCTGEPGIMTSPVTTADLRNVETRPTPQDVKPIEKSKRFIASCVTFCVTGASAVAPQIKSGADSVNQAIAPYVGQSTILHGLSSHLALVGAACAAATVALVWWQHRQDKAA